MNEEEKKAIQMIKNQKEEVEDALIAMEIPENYIGEDVEQEYLEWKKNAEIILNLIEKQKNRIASLEKQIKLMQSCDLAKVIKEQEKKIEQLANGIRVLGTNPDITTEEIIKEFTEKPITEEYMEEFESGYISKDEVLKSLGYEENDEEYKRIYNKEELILSLIHLINAECDRLEDIEDQKVMLEEHNIENMRDKYWQKKIRDKINEIEEHLNFENTEMEDYAIAVLKELLEE